MDERELFSRILDGEAGKDERTTMEISLAKDPLLREEWERWQAMDALLRSIPSESPSEGFAESVMSRLPTASPGRTSWLWGLAWVGGVLFSGVLIAAVLVWCLTRNPMWVGSTVALVVSSARVAQTTIHIWSVWVGAAAVVIRDLAIPVAIGITIYTAFAMFILGAIFRHRHATRLS